LDQPKKTIRVYADVVGDLWHYGHANMCKQAKQHGDYLIIGITPDELCASYKRQPVMTTMERVYSAQACKYVDEVVWEDVQLSITKEFIDKHKIDIVVHGDDFDPEKMKKYYSVPMELGMMRIIKYSGGVSTSELIKRIKNRQDLWSISITNNIVVTYKVENTTSMCLNSTIHNNFNWLFSDTNSVSMFVYCDFFLSFACSSSSSVSKNAITTNNAIIINTVTTAAIPA